MVVGHDRRYLWRCQRRLVVGQRPRRLALDKGASMYSRDDLKLRQLEAKVTSVLRDKIFSSGDLFMLPKIINGKLTIRKYSIMPCVRLCAVWDMPNTGGLSTYCLSYGILIYINFLMLMSMSGEDEVHSVARLLAGFRNWASGTLGRVLYLILEDVLYFFPCAWLYRQGILTPWTRSRRPIIDGEAMQQPF
ncbi:hypothetical protein CFP56_008082 [Quercus suber]|uniref:Uncharacterized protein n=1 Tax=Quercus suber TaxID=58331 RepID=A0AAW0L406_QUESU